MLDGRVEEGVEDNLKERRLIGIRQSMGPEMLAAMEDPEVVEVFLNPDSRLWAEKFGDMYQIGMMSEDDASVFLRQVASSLKVTINRECAIVEGELPTDGSRFEGIYPPIVERPVFNIRKKATKVYTFEDYVRANILTFAAAETLRECIAKKKNILVVGGTGSGKTTFCNAILACMEQVDPYTRIIIMEDTREMQCNLVNKVFLRAYEHATMQQLLRAIMRMRPDRIAVGEVRGGEALALLKAWNTGHPGGVCTTHADSAYKGLTRLDQLISEVSANPQRELIGEAVQIAVFLSRTNRGRKVLEIIEVNGYDAVKQRYNTKQLFSI